jgi:hypothetical protein
MKFFCIYFANQLICIFFATIIKITEKELLTLSFIFNALRKSCIALKTDGR